MGDVNSPRPTVTKTPEVQRIIFGRKSRLRSPSGKMLIGCRISSSYHKGPANAILLRPDSLESRRRTARFSRSGERRTRGGGSRRARHSPRGTRCARRRQRFVGLHRARQYSHMATSILRGPAMAITAVTSGEVWACIHHGPRQACPCTAQHRVLPAVDGSGRESYRDPVHAGSRRYRPGAATRPN